MSDADSVAGMAATEPAKLTAWQRWELPAFEAQHGLGKIGLPTAAAVELMHRQAREEGHAEGRQRGYADGLQQAAQDNRRLSDLMNVLEQQMDELVAQELLGLALDIARQVIQQALQVQPELLLPMVREAIGSLPVFNQAAHLILHPDDAALVRERMGEQLSHSGWKILEDPRMDRGGARLETANSQVDASLEARWKRVTAAMGQETPWLIKE